MKLFARGLAAVLLFASTATAFAADNWVGAWGFVTTPQPPGQAQIVASPPALVRFTAATPLTAPPDAAQAGAPPARAPLLENPGNLAILPNSIELSNVTVRQLVRVSVGGKQIRLRFANESGADVMPLGAVRVGVAGPDGSIVTGSDRAVTFDGKSGVIVPASSPLYSDPVNLAVKPLDRLLVSIHVPSLVPRGGHALYMYVTQTAGDNTAAASLPDAKLARVSAYVSMVEVNADTPHHAIVTLGDSITEGTASTANAFRGWPDRLADRLVAAKKDWTVVNAGIGGNRILRYGTGPSALARFDRDVLGVPGVKAVILLEAINDIGVANAPAGGRDPVTAEALIDGYQQLIARAHAHDIKIYAGLLTPYQGANYASPQGEQIREAVNNWIKTGGAFDGVIDFATPVADPANPLAFAAQFNDVDKLHPNDAGYAAMANAINLDMVTK